jgi:drug/metabolite transporter (DMT)-like permease
MLILGRPVLPAAPSQDYLLFVVSGVLGIAVSDTLLFWTLNLLGASLTAIVECLYSPFIIGLSYIFLGERMNARQLIGVALIVSAVLTISHKNENGSVGRKRLAQGIVIGIISMFFVAAGIVLVKPILDHSGVLWATMVRLAGGSIALALAMLFHPKRKAVLKPLLNLSHWKVLVPASVFGAYLSMSFWMGGMKYATASVAAALSQLNTIFIFILAAVFLKEKATALRMAAVVMAFAGAFLASAKF